jgi:hypothetical protein
MQNTQAIAPKLALIDHIPTNRVEERETSMVTLGF